jgi:hypothetical protein
LKIQRVTAVMIGIVLPLLPAGAQAAELKVYSSTAVKAALEELGPQFEKATGDKLVFNFGLSSAVKKQIDEGAAFDVAILTPAFARAHELSEPLGDVRQLFMAVFGLWVSANGRGGMVECRKFSHRLQRLTAADADAGLRLQAHHSAWTTCLFSGEPAAVREHCVSPTKVAALLIPSVTPSI